MLKFLSDEMCLLHNIHKNILESVLKYFVFYKCQMIDKILGCILDKLIIN